VGLLGRVDGEPTLAVVGHPELSRIGAMFSFVDVDTGDAIPPPTRRLGLGQNAPSVLR
jgi:hypothetical protein